MTIGKLTLTNFRGFRCCELPLDPRLTLLIGKSGCGKTSVLDAIELLHEKELWLRPNDIHHLPDRVDGGETSLFCETEHGGWRMFKLLDSPEQFQSQDSDRAKMFRYFRPQVENSKLNINPKEQHVIFQGLLKVFPEISLFDVNGDDLYVCLLSTLTEKISGKLNVEQLGEGLRKPIVMLVDIMYHMIQSHIQMENPFEGVGLVTIDGIDLGLHPQLQKDFLPKMIALFPNVQFVIATNSPFIIQSINKGSLVDLHLGANNLTPLHLGHAKGIEDIVSDWMGVDVARSSAFTLRNELSTEFYKFLDEGFDETDPRVVEIETNLSILDQLFGKNPAFTALLAAEKRRALGKTI